MAIIPQDPFLLEGTLKFNIDPLNQFEDDKIINGLKELSLDTILKNKKSENDDDSAEQESKKSTGQKKIVSNLLDF